MLRDKLLIALTISGSALCWLPAAVEPSVDFSRWILLVLVALMTGLPAALSNRHWLRFVVASSISVFLGLCIAFIIFPPGDGIAASYVPLVVLLATLAAAFVSLLAGLAGRKIALRRRSYRRAVWLAFLWCVAFGPIALALTRPVVANRVARNDEVAARRFESLKNAVDQTIAEGRNPNRLCDGQTLRKHYSGPPFSDEDWERITENYVKQDGYVFMVYCHEKRGYAIDALPSRGKADGTRHFCTDKSGGIGFRCVTE